LRFFGMIGVTMFLIGAALARRLVVERPGVRCTALTERPALLLVVADRRARLAALCAGLLGELIIFTHARSIKDYQVEAGGPVNAKTG
jgi:hypothetical protein